jgi:hypothetical protein
VNVADIVIPHKTPKARKKSVHDQLIDFTLRSTFSATAKHFLHVAASLADKNGMFKIDKDKFGDLMGCGRTTVWKAHKEIGEDIIASTHGNNQEPSTYTWNLAKVLVRNVNKQGFAE